MSIIEDGAGGSNKAQVDSKNRLQVSYVDEAKTAALNGDAYIFHIDAVTIDTTDYLIALMINKDTAERDMVVTKIDIGCRTSDDESQVEVNLGGTFTATVANSVAVVPANCLSGSNKDAGGIFYKNDNTGDMTTEANAYVAYSQMKPLKDTSATMEIPGGWIIPFGASISVSSNKDDIFYGCIHFYYRD